MSECDIRSYQATNEANLARMPDIAPPVVVDCTLTGNICVSTLDHLRSVGFCGWISLPGREVIDHHFPLQPGVRHHTQTYLAV